MSKLQAYDFDIEYVKGKNSVVADALSSYPFIDEHCIGLASTIASGVVQGEFFM